MSDYFERLRRENPEFRAAEEALEPGYQFAVTIHDLQNMLGVDFSEFCRLVGVDEQELEEVLINFAEPPNNVLMKILQAMTELQFKSTRDEAAAASA